MNRSHPRPYNPHRHPNRALYAAALLIPLLSACSAVNPAPFDKFYAGLTNVRSGTDTLLRQDYDWTRETFIDRQTRHPDVTKLTVRFPVDTSDFSASLPDPPLFVEVGDSSRMFYSLNSGFVEYAALLKELAGDQVVNQAEFDQLATDLNSAFTDAAKAAAKAGVSVPSSTPQAGGLISIGVSEAFHQYIECKRRALLASAIEATQPSVVEWIQLADLALVHVSADLQKGYEDRRRELAHQYAEAKSAADKRSVIEALSRLAESILDARATLAALRDTYQAVPEAHADLARSLRNDRLDLGTLRSFYDRARHLKDLYESFNSASDSKKS